MKTIMKTAVLYIAITIVATISAGIVSAKDKSDLKLEKIYNYERPESAYTAPPPITPKITLPKIIGSPSPRMNPIFISKFTKQRFNVNFTVKMDYLPHTSNFAVNVTIERNNDFKDINTISLHLGELFIESDESLFFPQHTGDLNIQIWRLKSGIITDSQDNDIFLNFSISPALSGKAYLILYSSYIIPNSFGRRTYSKQTYIIDLNSFVPELPTEKDHKHIPADHEGEDTIDIDFG